MTAGDTTLRLVDFLNHIEEAAKLARQYVDGMSQESFLKDRRIQQAIVLNLMTIGEAAARMQTNTGFRRSASGNSMGADARHAQPDGARLLRYRPIFADWSGLLTPKIARAIDPLAVYDGNIRRC
jgi:Protein of unknown function DUF86